MRNVLGACAALALAVMSGVPAASAAVSPALLESFKAIDACRKPLDARKAPYVEVFDALEKLRAEPLFATNAEVAANLDRQLLNLCHTPNWVGLKRWDTSLVDRIPAVARRNLDAPALPLAQKVGFSKTTIDSIADWRKIAATLDTQVCDRKFGANLDILDTDVATGRQAVEKTERDSKDVRMEVSSVCDTRGVHLFLRVADRQARHVEDGFAGGLGTEMYFSTGLYRPYVCFGSDPRKGVNSEFHTTYSNLGYRRPKVKSETSFTDTESLGTGPE